MKLAAERERAQREEAQRLLAEQQRTKLASVDRKQPTTPSLAGLSSDIRNVPPTEAAPANQAAPASADPCERDGAMLAQLRSNPSLEAVVQFERSLTCEKLRAQALRLQESLSSVANAAQAIAVPVVPAKPAIVAPPPVAAVAPPPPAPKQEAAPKPPADPPKVAVATAEPAPGCKQDEARLSKIRANPSLAELAALERDLGCERLRPQIVRLRESLPKTELSNDEPKPSYQDRQPKPRSAGGHAHRHSSGPGSGAPGRGETGAAGSCTRRPGRPGSILRRGKGHPGPVARQPVARGRGQVRARTRLRTIAAAGDPAEGKPFGRLAGAARIGRSRPALHLIPPYCGGLSPDEPVHIDRFRIANWAVTL